MKQNLRNSKKSKKMTEIKFYQTNRGYGCFSNFSRHPIVIDGKEYPTTEHYYQAHKFIDPKMQDELRNAKNAMTAAKMGRERTRPLREDWDEVKDYIMLLAVGEKLKQHNMIYQILVSTADCELIEHTSYDSYLGRCWRWFRIK